MSSLREEEGKRAREIVERERKVTERRTTENEERLQNTADHGGGYHFLP